LSTRDTSSLCQFNAILVTSTKRWSFSQCKLPKSITIELVWCRNGLKLIAIQTNVDFVPGSAFIEASLSSVSISPDNLRFWVVESLPESRCSMTVDRCSGDFRFELIEAHAFDAKHFVLDVQHCSLIAWTICQP
jgi:hypothetical protein